MFIVLEGIDGSGKTTAAHKLGTLILEELGKDVLVTKTPGGEPSTGGMVRELLLSPEYALNKQAQPFFFMGDMIQVAQEIIIPEIARGGVIICDRYAFSTYVYQIANSEHLSAKQKTTLLSCMGSFLPTPDMTFILDLPVSAAKERLDIQEFGTEDSFECAKLQVWEQRRLEYLSFGNSPLKYMPHKVLDVENLNPDEVADIMLYSLIAKSKES